MFLVRCRQLWLVVAFNQFLLLNVLVLRQGGGADENAQVVLLLLSSNVSFRSTTNLCERVERGSLREFGGDVGGLLCF